MMKLLIRALPVVLILMLALVSAAGTMGQSMPEYVISAVATTPPNYRYTLLLIDVERGVYIPIIPNLRGLIDITFSPNGQYALLRSGGAGRARFHILDLVTGSIFSTPTQYEITQGGLSSWSPDSSKFMFTASSDPTLNLGDVGESGLYVMDHQRQTLVRVYQSATAAVWSPDGQKIAIRSPASIFVVDADGNNHVDLSDSAGASGWIVWSPDSTRVMFETRGNLLVAQADGSAVRDLSAEFGMLQFPQWSPDGQWITFLASRDRKRAVFTLHLDSGQIYHLDTDSLFNARWADWSADSQQVVIVTDDAENSRHSGSIYAGTREGQRIRLVASGINPQLSPVGDHLVHQTWEHIDGRYSSRIYLTDLLSGSDGRSLISQRGDALLPAWSADGDKLTFIYTSGGTSRLIVVDSSGGGRVVLSNPRYYILRYAYWR